VQLLKDKTLSEQDKCQQLGGFCGRDNVDALHIFPVCGIFRASISHDQELVSLFELQTTGAAIQIFGT
jgi:hypothetical protein